MAGGAASDSDVGCFLFDEEPQCNAQKNADGKVACKYAVQQVWQCCKEAECYQTDESDTGCDGDVAETEVGTCSDICQASASSRTTCQNAGCCYLAFGDFGSCESKQGGECNADFTGDGDFGGDGDGELNCQTFQNKTSCTAEKNTDGAKLSKCAWTVADNSFCTGDSLDCQGFSNSDCEASDKCTLNSDEYAYCSVNDPCADSSAQVDCEGLGGCVWESNELDGGFCLAQLNEDAFNGLSANGTCSFDTSRTTGIDTSSAADAFSAASGCAGLLGAGLDAGSSGIPEVDKSGTAEWTANNKVCTSP